ncbi:hypothetical protein HYU91_01015 [Candidatus Collierbacteria bacterium]|nr:hypothetical protein [Candidatus Collierbacteria bacterium]
MPERDGLPDNVPSVGEKPQEASSDRESELILSRVVIDANFQILDTPPSFYLEDSEKEKVVLLRETIKHFRAQPELIISMPVLPTSESDTVIEKSERPASIKASNPESILIWLKQVGLSEADLAKKVDWRHLREAFRIGDVINDLICHYNYDQNNNPVGEISLRKFIELIRVSVCGDLYVQHMTNSIQDRLKSDLPDYAPQLKCLSVFNPSLKGRGIFLGEISSRHLIYFRTSIDVYSDPYFDYKNISKTDQSTCAHELVHARHAEELGGGEKLYVHGVKLENPKKDVEVDIAVRRSFSDFQYQTGVEESVVQKSPVWFILIEGFATYGQLKFINHQIEKSSGDNMRDWEKVKIEFMRRLRYLDGKEGKTRVDSRTQCMLEPYSKGTLLIHSLDKTKPGSSILEKLKDFSPESLAGKSLQELMDNLRANQKRPLVK